MGITLTPTTTAVSAPEIDPGTYDATLVAFESDTLDSAQYDPEVFVWTFRLLDEAGEVLYDRGEPVEVAALTSRSLNLASKTTPRAVRYLRALLRPDEWEAFTNGEPFDSEKLIGRRAQVNIELKENGWPRITDVFPPRRTKKAG